MIIKANCAGSMLFIKYNCVTVAKSLLIVDVFSADIMHLYSVIDL